MPSSGGGTVAYESSATAVCTIDSDGGNLAIVASGSCSITATIGDNTNYNAMSTDYDRGDDQCHACRAHHQHHGGRRVRHADLEPTRATLASTPTTGGAAPAPMALRAPANPGSRLPPTRSAPRSITISGLTNGNEYKAKLLAKAGTLSSAVATSDAVTPEEPAATTNEAPTTVGTIPAMTGLTAGGSTQSVDVSSYFSDPEGQTLMYSATSDTTSVATVSVSGSSVTVTPLAAGSATITVTATDPGNRTAEQEFTATVGQATSLPTLSITDASVEEGDDGDTPILSFTVGISPTTSDPITFTYATSDGTATAGTDYAAITNGSISTTANVASTVVPVSITGDNTAEGNETFTITLSNISSNAQFADEATTIGATGTIIDDDWDGVVPPGLSGGDTYRILFITSTNVDVIPIRHYWGIKCAGVS